MNWGYLGREDLNKDDLKVVWFDNIHLNKDDFEVVWFDNILT